MLNGLPLDQGDKKEKIKSLKGKKANMLTGSVKFINKYTIKLPKIGKVHIYPIPDKYWKKRTSICIGTTTISKDLKGQFIINNVFRIIRHC